MGWHRQAGSETATRRRQTRPRRETDAPAAGDRPPAEIVGDSLQRPPLRKPLSRLCPGSPAALLFHCRWPRQAHRTPASTYFHRRVIHMVAFRGLRGGGGAPAMSGHRQAAHTPAGGREKRPCGRPCRLLRSRRAVLVMDRHHGGPRSGPEETARPSDVAPSYESKYWIAQAVVGSGRQRGAPVAPEVLEPAGGRPP